VRASEAALSHDGALRSRRAAGPGSSYGPRAPRAGGERTAYPRRGTAASRSGQRTPRPGDDRPGPPRVGEEITADQLDPEARAELRTLPSDLADSVARYLVASGLAEDPAQAYQYAKQARKLAARVGVVREASGVAAYRAGEWADALAELRAARRLTGRDIGLPLMADSERALGRLDRALAIVHDPHTRALDRATQIELAIVESGIRRDQGMADAALLALQVPELTDGRSYPWSARLFYAYADALLEAGRSDEAHDWFARAAAADTVAETDAAERYEELDDVIIEDLAET
jgi:tetratricopeptide (TPR) repeat protein